MENPPPTRDLNENEIVKIMSALTEEPNRVAASALSLLIFTGLRLSEVLTARWEHVDLKQKQLYLPHTKAGRSRFVPLNDEAVAVLTNQYATKVESACVRSGASLYAVQKLLGHASPITTQRYAHLDNDVLRETSATAVQGYLDKIA